MQNPILKRLIEQKMKPRMMPMGPNGPVGLPQGKSPLPNEQVNHVMSFQQKIQEIQKNQKIPQKSNLKTIPIVIGITTLPERLRKLRTQQALTSILQNSILPEKIIISIPSKTLKGEEYPEDLFSHPVFKHPLVHIHRVEEDQGPVLKLNGLIDWLKKNPHSAIHNFVLMDDDIIYSKDHLQHLWNLHLRFPNASLGYAGRSFDAKTKKLNFLILHQSKLSILPVHIVETYHLTLHPLSHFLQDDWIPFVKECHEKCPESVFTDDILISLYHKKNNIPRFIFKGPSVKVNHHGTVKLSDTNLIGRNLRVFQQIWPSS